METVTLMAKCIHALIEPISIVLRLANGLKVRGPNAFQCSECLELWKYENLEDLPRGLYLRLKKEGRLPIPALTPEIMKALTTVSASSGPS